MSETTLLSISTGLADIVERVALSVVQVHGRRHPASGVVQAAGVVVTMARSLGREDVARVRTSDGRMLDAEVAAWDAATHLAVLRVPSLEAPAAVPASEPARTGQLGVAIGRSWSNAVTATLGMVSVIGGPLPTGRGLSIPEIIRTSAPMHQGFAGGAFADASGRLIGIATAAEIRGLAVVIPADVAWRTVKDLLDHGQRKRGYLGLAGQAVTISERQRGPEGPEHGLIIMGVTSSSPAESAGLLVGDVLVAFAGQPIHSPEDLLHALSGDLVGQTVVLRVLRGSAPIELPVTVAARA